MGLYRRRARAGTSEEVVAPFDAGASFRFFSVGDATSQAAPPADLNRQSQGDAPAFDDVQALAVARREQPASGFAHPPLFLSIVVRVHSATTSPR